ncbi:MAG: hypothetical protein JNL12_23530 [Planctomycetes bacterium]|nr:hypothetical protein [Planctomycetota bacterium]
MGSNANVAAVGLRVQIDVTAHERYLPPPGSRVEAAGPDGAAWPTQVLAGAGAGFDTKQPAGPALVQIDGPDRTLVRHVVLPADESIAYRTLGPVAIEGTVRGPDGVPRRGARVWFGETRPDGSRIETETDASGAFVGEALGGRGVPFVVQAAGCVVHHAQLDLTGVVSPIGVTLQAACAVDVQLAGVAQELGRARLFVLPAAEVSTELAQWPFWLQTQAGGVPFDGGGRASFEGLPRNGAVRLWVAHPEAPAGAPVEVALKGERVRATASIGFAANVLRGRLVDVDGAPVVGASVFAVPGTMALASGAAPRLTPPHLEMRSACAAQSDADGGFAIGLPGDRELVRLLLRAPGRAGRDLSIGDAERGPLVLPAWRGGEPEFTVSPPASAEPWTAATDLSGGVVESLAADQSFRLSLPYAGRFTFVLRTFDGAAEVASRTLADVVVTGPIELAAPQRP